MLNLGSNLKNLPSKSSNYYFFSYENTVMVIEQQVEYNMEDSIEDGFVI